MKLIFFFISCLGLPGCSLLTDPKIYEDAAPLVEEILKDEAM